MEINTNQNAAKRNENKNDSRQSPQNKKGLRNLETGTFEYKQEDSMIENQRSPAKDNNELKEYSKENNVAKELQSQQKQSQLTPQEQEEFSKLKKKQKYSEYYYFEKLLGQGAFCSVYQAIDNQSGETIAVKVIRRKNLNQNDVYLLRQEAEILKTMDHQNIVKFKHIREIGGRFFLGMELLKGGQLTELIKSRKDQNKKFTDEEASTIMRCILQAVAYIHSIGIVHRDIKPDNILVGDVNDLTQIKLGDFGLSAKYEHSSFTTLDQHCGTLIFMAPEVALKKEYSKSVDVWSLGIIMYMLLTGGSHPLFSSKDSAETYKEKLRKIKQLSFPSHLSVLAKNLFIRLTKFNIAQRYGAADGLQHPWITRINKTLIPLTLPDKMNNLEQENKLRNKMSLMFFASIVKKTSMRNGGLKENNFTDPDMFNYKRLLNKVTKKIDRWYDEKQKLNKVLFERDEEFIEHEQSPTNFETSSDEDFSIDSGSKRKISSKGVFDARSSEITSNASSSKKNKFPKSNPHSFKLSLLETNNDNLKSGNIQEDEEEADFMQFLKNQDNQKKGKTGGNLSSMQQQNFPRRKSLKKGSIAASPPVKRDQQLIDRRKKSPNKVNSSIYQGEGLLSNHPESGASTQTSNQQAFLNQLQNQEGSPNITLKIQNQSSYGSYQDQNQFGFKAFQKDYTPGQNQYQSVKHASSKFPEQSMEEQLRQQNFINSDRVLQIQQPSQFNKDLIVDQNAYPLSSSTFVGQSGFKKSSNVSQISGAADISIYDINLGETNPNTNSNFVHQKRNLKSIRGGEDQNNKKSQPKKQNAYGAANALYHQSYPQQIVTHQINLNDILKKNEGYDQKFLFKKNFIPKQKPVMMSNQMMQSQQTQQQYYQAHGNSQSGQNSMHSTNTGYPFQNLKSNKRSGKKTTKSHSQSGTNPLSSNINSTMNKKLNQTNMPLNYFTLSVDNQVEESRYGKESKAPPHKFWNQSSQEGNPQHYQSHQNTKNSSSDLPMINPKNSSYQNQTNSETQNIINSNLPLQKSKTGKNYDKNSTTSTNMQHYQLGNYNGVFSGAANLIKEEDSIIVSYHNIDQIQQRPITTGGGQASFFQSSQNNFGQGGYHNQFKHSSMSSVNGGVNRNVIEQQQTQKLYDQYQQHQHTFDQHLKTQFEEEKFNSMGSQFQTPNLTKKQMNTKMKGLDLSNGISKVDPQYTMNQNNNFKFSEDSINIQQNMTAAAKKDLILANQSFDAELFNSNKNQNQSSYAESAVKTGQSHKRHKSMSNKIKPSQINFSNNPISSQNVNSLQNQYQGHHLNQTVYEADFKQSNISMSQNIGSNHRASISQNHRTNGSIASSTTASKQKVDQQYSGYNSKQNSQLQQIIVSQIDNGSANNSYVKQSGKNSMNTTQFQQYHLQNNSQVNASQTQYGQGSFQNQLKTSCMPQNGIQGQQVTLTDNYVNGQTNQLVKYKNKIIIRQP